jgi:hypothetical protein
VAVERVQRRLAHLPLGSTPAIAADDDQYVVRWRSGPERDVVERLSDIQLLARVAADQLFTTRVTPSVSRAICSECC